MGVLHNIEIVTNAFRMRGRGPWGLEIIIDLVVQVYVNKFY
jgi:hypothetical protein